ncbi:MAG TPA: futalosine hydrolase [Egibacteraceae bacterium]|nr:futalosine hydrolase [Egibacteraceae bacterium]
MIAIVTATWMEAARLEARLSQRREADAWGVAGSRGALAGVDVTVYVTGVARACTAFALSRVLLTDPTAVIQVGVGGAFPGSGLTVGEVAVATSDTYADVGAMDGPRLLDIADLGLRLAPTAPGQTFLCDGRLIDALAVGGIARGAFLTSETVTGSQEGAQRLRDRWGEALVESMEGAAAAHACLLEAVPFAQLRGVSNQVGPRDRAAWGLDAALDAATEALLGGLPAAADALEAARRP